MSLEQMGTNARKASRRLAVLSSDEKNNVLTEIANQLRKSSEIIMSANSIDIKNGKAAGLSDSLLDRLLLDEKRINAMADGCISVAQLPDPIGESDFSTVRPNGLSIERVRVPIGVIGIIYEARPNVTADAAALCLKAGNAVILRGGKEAINSNKAIAEVMRKAIKNCGVPEDAVSLVTDTSRESSKELMELKYLDVLIPRGGKGLIKAVVENAKVPVIETGSGNCHAFVDYSADINMAADIVCNAKCSRPSVCNALETVLVDEKIAAKALPEIAKKLWEYGTEIRGCEKCREILGERVVPATDEDYATEFLDYVISAKVVSGISEAIDHITKYSSGHSECIITKDGKNAERFLREIDSAAVYLNASTRFTDGGEFGFGAEIGISTQKLHARGPMGLMQLTSMKYLIHGNGQIR